MTCVHKVVSMNYFDRVCEPQEDESHYVVDVFGSDVKHKV